MRLRWFAPCPRRPASSAPQRHRGLEVAGRLRLRRASVPRRSGPRGAGRRAAASTHRASSSSSPYSNAPSSVPAAAVGPSQRTPSARRSAASPVEQFASPRFLIRSSCWRSACRALESSDRATGAWRRAGERCRARAPPAQERRGAALEGMFDAVGRDERRITEQAQQPAACPRAAPPCRFPHCAPAPGRRDRRPVPSVAAFGKPASIPSCRARPSRPGSRVLRRASRGPRCARAGLEATVGNEEENSAGNAGDASPARA